MKRVDRALLSCRSLQRSPPYDGQQEINGGLAGSLNEESYVDAIRPCVRGGEPRSTIRTSVAARTLRLIGLSSFVTVADRPSNAGTELARRGADAPFELLASRARGMPGGLTAARAVLFGVTGKEKAQTLRTVLEGPRVPNELPCQLIHPNERGARVGLGSIGLRPAC